MPDSETAQGTEEQTFSTREWFEPADEYDGYFALLANGRFTTDHVVDTETFGNLGPAPADYDGHAASIGEAKTLCGRELLGRMIPLEQDNYGAEKVCGTCKRILESHEVLD